MKNACLRIEHLREYNRDAKFLIEYSMADLMPDEESSKRHVFEVNGKTGKKDMRYLDYKSAKELESEEVGHPGSGIVDNYGEKGAHFSKHQHPGREVFIILKGEMHLHLHDSTGEITETIILDTDNYCYGIKAYQLHSADFKENTLFYAFLTHWDSSWPKPPYDQEAG